MTLIIPKKKHKQAWEEAQRNASAMGYVSFHPYDNRARSLHPYAVDNPNNPYASPRTRLSEMSEKPKQERPSSDNPSEIESG